MENEVKYCRDFCKNIDPSWLVFADLDDQEIPSTPYPLQEELADINDLYTNSELIAEGGMKQIFSVRDVKSNRAVAMARIKEGVDKEVCEKFLREARITASLQHPNILSVYDIGVDADGMPYFTMELMQGGQPLSEIVNIKHSVSDNGRANLSQTISVSELLEIFVKVCDAVSYAHSRGVLHLDLKPDNIFIGEFGEVYLYDWGLAKLLSDEDVEDVTDLDPNILNDVTNTGFIKGTPGYMAPEQISRNVDKGVTTDVYSLGALLYTMLTGAKPVLGETAGELIENTLAGKVSALSKSASHSVIATGLEAVLVKSLQLKQEDRYQSVEALNVDIRNYLNGFATMAEQAGPFTRSLLLINRHKNIFTALLFSLLFALCILTAAYLKVNEERKNALEQQMIAEENLELYLKTEEAMQSIEVTLSSIIRKQIRPLDLSHVGIQLDFLKHHIGRVEEGKKSLAYEKKGILHFIFQQYGEAEESFSRVTEGSDSLQNLMDAAKLGREQLGSRAHLSDNQMATVVMALRPYMYAIIEAAYMNHVRKNHNGPRMLGEYEKLARVMLYMENNLWDELDTVMEADISKESRDGILDLSNSLIRDLRLRGGYGTGILTPVKLSMLNVSHSRVRNFNQLTGINTKTINIVGCRMKPITKLYWLQQMKKNGVKTVILTPSLFSNSDLKLLKRYFTIADGTQ